MFSIAVAQVASAQQFAGQQFTGQYPNIAPSQSGGAGYYASAMQASGRSAGPMSPPPSLARSYPAAPPRLQPTLAPPAYSTQPHSTQPQSIQPTAPGPLAGLKSSLGKFANPVAPPIPTPQYSASQFSASQYTAPQYTAPPNSAPPTQPAWRQQSWMNQAPTAAPTGVAVNPATANPVATNPAYANQPAAYHAPASPYAQYAASVAARAAYSPPANTAHPHSPTAYAPAAYTAAPANTAPAAAAANRGASYGASSLMASNQPMLAPGFAPSPAPGFPTAPAYDSAGPNPYGAPGMPGAPNSAIWQQQQPSAVPDPVSTGNFGGMPYGDPSMMGQQSTGCAPEENYFDPGVYDPGIRSCGPWFASVSGLIMTRDVPNNVGLAYVGADPHGPSILNTETAGFDWSGGVEAKLGRMIGDRWAMEVVYWWIDPSNGFLSARSEANDINSRLDMSQVLYEGTPLSTIYENSHEQRVYRADSFQNVEVNLLQQALVVDPANRFGIAYFSGVRYFRYREILEYYAVQAGSEFSDNDVTTQSAYHIRMRNSLIGWQLGARGHMYLGQRLRLYATPRFGLFANAISQQQDLCMVINLHSTKTDVAVLGQIDLGASLQLTQCCSVFAGYRAMGIAGVANADDQIARTFDSLPDMAQINSSGSIILHGVNTGLQFQF
ncbi:MAG: hypothetical protein K8U03_23245 [Planctomycetia bacterium]|nr:hypothetical protein [Planctomycetia bacterium]